MDPGTPATRYGRSEESPPHTSDATSAGHSNLTTVSPVVLHFDFARIHRTLRVTSAMTAGLATHVWTIEEIVGLSDTASVLAA